MLSVEAAAALIRANLPLMPAVAGRIEDLPAAVLRQELRADRPLPPYDRVAMDGIALAWASWRDGRRVYELAGLQRAGDPQRGLPSPQACLEVMTGSVLPAGCDCVLRYEDIRIEDGQARLPHELELSPYQNVHRRGSDCGAGTALLHPGTRMGPLQWALAAGIGAARPLLAQTPRITLIATGDELVAVEAQPAPHQIRESNLWMLAAALKQAGFERLSQCRLPDEPGALAAGLCAVLAEADVLILSGGVSMGKFDLVPELLQAQGVRQVFHKLAQRPGKPLWFGVGPQAQPVFGLPGNPVSAAICFRRYVLPALQQMLGAPLPPPGRAVLMQDLRFVRPLTWFMPVSLSWGHDGRRLATPVASQGSGDFASLAASDGFLELPPGPAEFKAGEVHDLWQWS